MRRTQAKTAAQARALHLLCGGFDCARDKLSYLRFAVLCFVPLLALSGCGSVQTTSSAAPGSIAQFIPDPPAPVINGMPPAYAQVGIPYDYTPDVSDVAGTALTFDITNLPTWATFNTGTGELAGTPGVNDVGTTAEIEIGVSDGVSRATVGPFRITINPQQSSPPVVAPPTISGTPAASVSAGQPYLFVPAASDPNGDTLSFLIVNRPSWASFNTATGQLSGTPSSADTGSYANITIGVSNGTLSASLPTFTITVSAPAPPPVNEPPTISGAPATSVDVGSGYSFTPAASDPEGQSLTFSIQNKPSWSSFNTGTGRLSGTPASANTGTYANITISVSDGTLTASLPAFTITVSPEPPDGPPTISGTPATTVNAGSTYSFTPGASDPEGHSLTFSITNQPPWAAFSTSTGRLSGTPSAANIGAFTDIIISVSNGTLAASLHAFAITVAVQPPDGSPTISGTPATSVTTGSAYGFTPNASDPQGHALTFSIQNLPAWASFNTNTGKMSGTPASVDVGSFLNITISVTNGTHSASLPAFTITVSAPATPPPPPPDGPPTIGGTPATSINVASAYSFTPSASDPEGHALSFSIQNQPSWASFNTNTGQLSGTPSAANVGDFFNITITVSNGTLTASLPEFSITVTQAPRTSVTLNWSTPTQNTNGTPLTNLAGFRIYYGNVPGNLSQSAQIASPGVTTYLIGNLTPGTWYFGLVDYTATGMESSLSNIASTTIQ
jgi:hypothetical protein